MRLNCEPERARLYRVRPNGEVCTLREGLTIANGLAWDLGRERFYHIDSPRKTIDVFRWPDLKLLNSITGLLDEIQPLIPGTPVVRNGLEIDLVGRLWVATYGGGKVLCVDPAGAKIVTDVVVPEAAKVTRCCFGGAEKKTLFIATIREAPIDLETYPDSGSIFKIELDSPAVSPPYRFKV